MGYDDAAKGEIRGDLTTMYRNGKVDLPARADRLAEVTTGMGWMITSVNIGAARMGDPPPLQDALDLMVDCQNGMARAVTSVNNLARAVVAQADDFRDRDDFARRVFESLGNDLRGAPAPLPLEPTEVDKQSTLDPGAPWIGENPDVQSPEEELDDRDNELETYQHFGGDE